MLQTVNKDVLCGRDSEDQVSEVFDTVGVSWEKLHQETKGRVRTSAAPQLRGEEQANDEDQESYFTEWKDVWVEASGMLSPIYKTCKSKSYRRNITDGSFKNM